jgi:hypothetical protein
MLLSFPVPAEDYDKKLKSLINSKMLVVRKEGVRNYQCTDCKYKAREYEDVFQHIKLKHPFPTKLFQNY